MIIAPDALFRAERATHRLRMHCEDCALFDSDCPPPTRCAHGYPTEPHRAPDADDAPVAFCKDFEPC
ncbi:MAG: hypothetical protein ACK6CU_14585 [Deltaproteobacteria bacterium]|jgi:hypothetical protein